MTHAGAPPKPASPTPSMEEFLLHRPGFEVTHENGQRRFGPAGDRPPPPRGSEVFVGKLPRDLLEDELVPHFEAAGAVRETRLMMDYGGFNRGYAFVLYAGPEEARRAVERLDNSEIRKGRTVGVCKSVDNCRLFVGGIPKSKTKEEILEEMRKVTEKVCDVILYSSIADKSKNRGFAFVEYESHKAAAVARRKLIPGKIPLWGHDIAVDWAEPEPEVDDETMAKVTILYVRNLMMNTTEETIKELFSLQDALKVDKVKKLRDFAFVHYRTREDAETALQQLNNIDIDGSTVEVTWAKPVDRFVRQRNHPRPGLHPFVYGPPPGYEPYGGHMPFPNCPGRGPVLQRVAMRGRGRGAAGIRRFRAFAPAFHPTYKPQEGSMAPHSSHYPQFQPNKLGRISEEGKSYTPEYMYILNPAAEGMESAMAVPGPALLPYGPHPRLAHQPGFMHAAQGYDEVPCYTYLPSGSISSY